MSESVTIPVGQLEQRCDFFFPLYETLVISLLYNIVLPESVQFGHTVYLKRLMVL